jgi:hypothetical protein
MTKVCTKRTLLPYSRPLRKPFKTAKASFLRRDIFVKCDDVIEIDINSGYLQLTLLDLIEPTKKVKIFVTTGFCSWRIKDFTVLIEKKKIFTSFDA